MRNVRTAGRHQLLRSGAAVGITCLALLAGGLVGGIQPAQAATIPTNPCVRPEPVPVTTRPVVTRVSTSTRVVDVRRHATTLRVTVRAHDTVAITRVIVTVSQVRRIGKTVSFTALATLVSGTPTAGTWRAAVLMPRFIPAGTYRVSRVLVHDVGRGRAAFFHRVLPNAWPARLQVRSVPDRTAPVVTGLRVSARAVDTRTAPTTLTLRVTARDALSGVARVTVWAVGVDPASAPTQPPNNGVSTGLVRSTDHRHLWIGRVVVPMWSGISTWNLSIRAVDVRGHTRTLHGDDLARRGWQSTLRVTSGRDVATPSLTGLSFTASTVDARSSSLRVDVTYRVSDAQSGPSGRSRLTFHDQWWAEDAVVTAVSGTATDRTYQGYVLVPQCGLAASSTFTATAVLYDNAHNERGLAASELATLGFPTELSVLQRDSRPPWLDAAPIPAGGGSLELIFSEPVLMAQPPSALLHVEVQYAAAAGTWVCRNGADDVVVCDADDAAVDTATFTPTTAFEVGQRVTVRRVTTPPARIGIYDLDGVPLEQAVVSILVR